MFLKNHNIPENLLKMSLDAGIYSKLSMNDKKMYLKTIRSAPIIKYESSPTLSPSNDIKVAVDNASKANSQLKFKNNHIMNSRSTIIIVSLISFILFIGAAVVLIGSFSGWWANNLNLSYYSFILLSIMCLCLIFLFNPNRPTIGGKMVYGIFILSLLIAFILCFYFGITQLIIFKTMDS